jgi:hypothetical protein
MPRRGSRRRRALPAFEPIEPRLLLTANLAITEFMADNSHTLADHEGDSSDWIEVYNKGTTAADLSGLHLTDAATNLTKWEFPAGVTLNGDSYLVVFASDKNRNLTWTDGSNVTHTEYHTNFKLGAKSGYLGLIDRDGATILAQYSPAYPQQLPDVSYGLPELRPPPLTPVVTGAAARYLVPHAVGDLPANWADPGFIDTAWTAATTGLGYDVYAVPAPPVGANKFYYAPFGPSGAWHLYEVVTTTTTWIAACNAANAKSQVGVNGQTVYGHLVTITSEAENRFVRSIGTTDSWIGLTDSENFAGTHEYGNTSGWGAPTEGQVPASNQRGAGFVWVTGEPFTYHLNVWDSGQPNNSGTYGQDGVMTTGSNGLWNDQPSGEGSQTGTNRAYVIEYDLNLPSMGPAFTVVAAATGTALSSISDGVALLNAGGGTYYNSPFINFIDPQSYAKGHFGGCLPFGGDDPSQVDTNFAVRVTATVRIPTAGTWTFGVNSDDGFRLKIDGATFTAVSGTGTTMSGDTMEHAAARDRTVDSLGVATLSAGDHAVQLDYYQGAGGGGLEFFAASGSQTSFNASFRLVGDTRNGGLALADVKDSVATDIQAALKGVNASAFVRIPFAVADVAGIQYLTLRMKYDDGFVAYLNGHEVERANAPDTLAWNSPASGPRQDSQAVVSTNFDISDMAGVLAPGANVLAIQGLNASAGDEDFLVAAELTVTFASVYASQPRYFVLPTPGADNGAGAADLGPIVTDVFQPATAPGDNAPLVVTAKVVPTFNPVIPATVTLHYRVMWNAEVPVQMYDDGLHGDGAAGDHVYAAAIPASASSVGQMVRWYVTAADGLGRTGRWPLFEDQSGPSGTGSPEYLGTMIADPTIASTMPVFYWFVQDPAAAADTNRAGTDAGVYYDGEFFDNVFTRFRGGYATGGTKFDFNKGYSFRWDADHQRVSEVDLNYKGGLAPDDAWIRPIVSFETYRDAGCPYSETFMVRVQQATPTGTNVMFRINVEQVDDEYLKRQGLYQGGALYKMTADVPQMQYASQFEKKNRDAEGSADLQAFLDGIHQADPAARARYLFDHFDIPRFLDYQAATVLIQEMDSAQKNYYLYCDTTDAANPNGTGLWMLLPWDEHLTFGKNYGINDYKAVDPQAHPFFADSEHPKIDGPGAWNWLIDVLLDVPPIKEMYLRRLRTLMDKLLQPADTPYAQRYYETRLDELYTQLKGDAAFVAQNGDLKWAFDDIKNKYLGDWYDGSRWRYGARTHFYVDHSQNAYYPDFAGIPPAELGSPPIGFGTFEVAPASGNQEEEYIDLGNPNAFAVDISGWKLTGGVDYTFSDGVVIPAGGSLYVSPNVAAFRARTTSPKGGEGLFVQGNYDGHLTNWGETVLLLDNHNRRIDALSYTAAPSDAQRYLRATEVMYHPLGAPPGSGFNNDDYEYIELQNTSAAAALALAGVTFAEGVLFDFTGSGVAGLAPGAYALVVANTAAFQSRYGHAYDAIIAGRFAAGNLAGGGEQIRLLDAQGDTILSFTYGDKWYYNTDGEGFSLTVRDPLQLCRLWDSGDGWRPSRLVGGSPGAADADLAPGAVEIAEILAHQDTEPPGDWIELTNTTGSAVDLAGWYLSDDALDLTKYRITADSNHPSTVIQPGAALVFYETYDFGVAGNPGVATPFALSELGDTVYLTSVVSPGGALAGYRETQSIGPSEPETAFTRYVKICLAPGESPGANYTYGIDFVAESAKTPGADNAYPKVGPVVINEIMYHPGAGGDEFIELKNVTGAVVPLYDPAHPANTWKFTDGITFAFGSTDTIPANGYALVVPIAPSAFRTKYGIPAGVPIFGPYTGALDNKGETLELSKPGGPEPPPLSVVPYYRVDRVTYNDGAGAWPIMADGFGPSLIRKVAADYGNDVANWAVGNTGGTPGAANRALDATPPTTPTGLTAVLTSPTLITLNWSAATDPQTGVLCYAVYNNGSKIATSTTNSYQFKSVWPSSGYSFQVAAVNGDNVEGAPSAATPSLRVVTLNSAKATDATTVQLTFSEAMNRDSAQMAGKYTVTVGGLLVTVTQALLMPGQKIVALTLATPITPGTTCTAMAAALVTKTGFPLLPNSQATFSYTSAAAGNVLREWWLGIGGTAVTDLTTSANYPDNPSGSDQPTTFEAPTDWADNYGQRMRAYVTAPATGAYVFWIASDDSSELWLSTDDKPANRRRIAYVPGWTNSRVWTTYTQQCSTNVVATINLVAGQRYYIEALMKEGSGGDNLCVRWQLPSTVIEEPIPASRLAAFVPTPSTTVSIQATTPAASESGQAKGTFTITRTGGTALPLTVYYTVTGTASTTDVQEDLTGIAQIPAGALSAAIDVTPIDDHVTEGDETVCLALLPDKKYAVGMGDATVTILDSVLPPPTVTGIELNGVAGRSASAFDPSGRGIETLRITFSEAMSFAPADLLVQKVTFNGNAETVTGTLAPGLAGFGTSEMRISFAGGSIVDTWIKVTLKGSGTLQSVAGNRRLDGEPKAGGSGRSYIYVAADLPTGDGTQGGDAVFYVGSLRGDYASVGGVKTPDLQVTPEDIDGFLAKFQAADSDADFRGAGFSVAAPDGQVTPADLDAFLSAYNIAVAEGRHLDALPNPGPQGAGEPAAVLYEPAAEAAGDLQLASPAASAAGSDAPGADETQGAMPAAALFEPAAEAAGDFLGPSSAATPPRADEAQGATLSQQRESMAPTIAAGGDAGISGVPLAASARAAPMAAADPVLSPDGGVVDLLALPVLEVPLGM